MMTILRPKAAIKKTGLPHSTIYRKAADPNDPFPQPIKLGERASGWIEQEIDQWIADRISESRGKGNGGR